MQVEVVSAAEWSGVCKQLIILNVRLDVRTIKRTLEMFHTHLEMRHDRNYCNRGAQQPLSVD